MKKYLLVLFFATTFFTAKSQKTDTNYLYNKVDSLNQKKGLWRGYFKDEKTSYLYCIESYQNGKLDGLCTYYFPNGKVRSEDYYTNDTLDGFSKVYRQDGTMYSSESFSHGMNHGVKTFYDYLGFKSFSDTYYYGVRNGKSIIYYRSGNIQIETTYVNNIEEGIRKVFADKTDQELLKEFVFKNGVRILARTYKKNRLVKEESFDYNTEIMKDIELKKKLQKE
jgi:antitoxin component YwqK of YwqJK toxin-antitoxin module